MTNCPVARSPSIPDYAAGAASRVRPEPRPSPRPPSTQAGVDQLPSRSRRFRRGPCVWGRTTRRGPSPSVARSRRMPRLRCPVDRNEVDLHDVLEAPRRLRWRIPRWRGRPHGSGRDVARPIDRRPCSSMRDLATHEDELPHHQPWEIVGPRLVTPRQVRMAGRFQSFAVHGWPPPCGAVGTRKYVQLVRSRRWAISPPAAAARPPPVAADRSAAIAISTPARAVSPLTSGSGLRG